MIEPTWRRAGLFGAVALALLLAPLLHYLLFFGYPLSQPELLPLFGWGLGVALAVGIASRYAPLFGAFGLSLVLIHFLCRAAGLTSEAVAETLGASVPAIETSVASLLGYVGLALGMALLLKRLPDQNLLVLVVGSAAVLVATVVGGAFGEGFTRPAQGHTDVPLDETLPPWIHIVLDEQMSPSAIPSVPGSEELRAEVGAFLERQGFAQAPDAYSRHAFTPDSLTTAFGYSPREESLGTLHRRRLSVHRNLVLTDLQSMGYRLHVYGLQNLDLCDPDGADVQRCYRWSLSDPRPLVEADLPVLRKTLILTGMFLRDTPSIAQGLDRRLTRDIAWWWGGSATADLPGLEPDVPESLLPATGLAALDTLFRDVARHPRGTAFVAHVTIPHFPYALDPSCTVKADPSRWFTSQLFARTRVPREARYEAYVAQVRCLFSRLRRAFETGPAAEALRGATFVIHGDHGSRNNRTFPHAVEAGRPAVWDQAARDAFSILFAVRRPEIGPGRIAGAKPLEQLLRETYRNPQVLRTSAPDPAYVLLSSSTGTQASKPLVRMPVTIRPDQDRSRGGDVPAPPDRAAPRTVSDPPRPSVSYGVAPQPAP